MKGYKGTVRQIYCYLIIVSQTLYLLMLLVLLVNMFILLDVGLNFYEYTNIKSQIRNNLILIAYLNYLCVHLIFANINLKGNYFKKIQLFMNWLNVRH